MQSIQCVEYTLALNTGEILEISELDYEVIQELHSPTVLELAREAIRLCSKVPRDVIEEAKLGNSKKLEPFLGITPSGALIRYESPVCALIRDCGSANREVCTTRNPSQKPRYSLPVCWEPAINRIGSETDKKKAAELSFIIVHAWRERRHVLLVDMP